MTRAPLEAKAARLLASGALIVHEVGPTIIRATCQGDSGKRYHLGWAPRGGFGCSCPAGQFYSADCSHLRALKRVVRVPSGDTGLTAQRLLAEQRAATITRNGRLSA